LNGKISDKDKKDWENFINSQEKLPDKDPETQNKKLVKSRTLDLHGFSLENANLAVEEFINRAYLEKISKLLIVTGKGIHSNNEKNPFISKELGILKYSVPEFIFKNENLMKIINSLEEARVEDGGGGAFYIYLKKNNK
tara:strand:- start:756 stop:1172 length:417 start_codon:yes stop_codon:yes gene_type:complete